ncbi:MAG TPA: hypothetical protein VGC62_09630 [Pseudomonas sp.]|uniref:hypothetical protein n=1 Tax=Pseudomonas sp. TaxID=306 RepID=UPI002ED8C276
MKTTYVLFRAGENYGQQSAVGWFDTEIAAKDAAIRMEWDECRKEAEIPSTMSRLLSPDDTEYRRFSVEPLDRLN